MTIAERLREDARTVRGALVAQNMRKAADALERLERRVQELEAKLQAEYEDQAGVDV